MQSKRRNAVERRGPSGGGRSNLWSGCFPHLRGVRDSQDESEQQVGAVLSPLQTERVSRSTAPAGGVLLFAVEGVTGRGGQPLEKETENAK